MSMLAVEKLVAGHGLLAAVREVSFDVGPGEVLGVIGANGAGKTTLFRTLAGVPTLTIFKEGPKRAEFDAFIATLVDTIHATKQTAS